MLFVYNWKTIKKFEKNYNFSVIWELKLFYYKKTVKILKQAVPVFVRITGICETITLVSIQDIV